MATLTKMRVAPAHNTIRVRAAPAGADANVLGCVFKD